MRIVYDCTRWSIVPPAFHSQRSGDMLPRRSLKRPNKRKWMKKPGVRILIETIFLFLFKNICRNTSIVNKEQKASAIMNSSPLGRKGGWMTDFWQQGTITVLQRLKNRPIEELESEIEAIARRRRIVLLLPALYSEFETASIHSGRIAS